MSGRSAPVEGIAMSTVLVVKMMVAIVAFSLFAGVGSAEPSAQIDHIILGVADLDQGIETFEQLTGVRPVYGGRHPVGTHNALVSLGGRTYLEIIAVQPGASPPSHFTDLSGLKDALTCPKGTVPFGSTLQQHP